MNIDLHPFQISDLPFLEEMLYEAVFWRKGPDTPSFEEARALTDVRESIAAMGSREGDAAVIASTNGRNPVGAAWMRYWDAENDVRGFIAEDIPVLALGVKAGFRNQGIGGMMIDWLVEYAEQRSIPTISLCVSKDNRALNLYRKKGFLEYSDLGHSFNMKRSIV